MTLLRNTVRSVAWTSVGSQASAVATLVSSILVARLVSPTELGTYALPALIVALATSGASLFAGNYYVITDRPSERLLRTGLALELMVGSGLGALVTLGGVLYAVGSGGWEFAGLLAAEALLLPLNPWANPVGGPTATYTRRFAYRTPTLVWAAASITSASAKVVLVAAGLGPWGLVAGDVLLGCLYAGAMLALVPAARGIALDRSSARELLRFGVPSLATSVFMLGSERASEVAVAALLGTRGLGFYYLATRIPTQLYQVAVGASVSLLTTFSRATDAQLARAFTVATRVSAFLVCVPLAIAIPLSGPLVDVVYGEKWGPAALPLTLLLAAVAVRFTFWHAWNMLKSRGRVREIARLTGAQLALVGAGSFLGAAWEGLAGAAAAVLIVELVLVAPKLRLVRALVPFDVLGALRQPLLCLAGGVLAGAGLLAVLPDTQALLASAVLVSAFVGFIVWRSETALLGEVLGSFRGTAERA